MSECRKWYTVKFSLYLSEEQMNHFTSNYMELISSAITPARPIDIDPETNTPVWYLDDAATYESGQMVEAPRRPWWRRNQWRWGRRKVIS